MMENSTYSVITPEGCAAILWKDSGQASRAAASLKITAPDLQRLGLVDRIIEEPNEGAHTDWDEASATLKRVLIESLDRLENQSQADRLKNRYAKFRAMGTVLER